MAEKEALVSEKDKMAAAHSAIADDKDGLKSKMDELTQERDKAVEETKQVCYDSRCLS